MKKATGILGLFLAGGALAAPAWADEIIEMATYIPAPGTGNDLDRLHAKRATIGDPYSLNPANPAEPDPPNGTLLVAQKVGIGMAAPETALEVSGMGRFRWSGEIPLSGTGLELYYVSATEGLIGGWVSAIDRGAPAYKDLFLSGSSLRFHTSGSERMRVDSGGNVGIGNTSPAYSLLVQNNVTGEARSLLQLIGASVGRNPRLNIASGNTETGSHYIELQTDADNGVFPAFVLQRGGGNVGIGTASPQALLDVNGAAVVRGILRVAPGDTSIAATNDTLWTTLCGGTGFNGGVVVVRGPNQGASCEFYSRSTSNRTFMVADNGTVSGAFGAYHSPSDGRLKRDIASIPHALDKVLALRGVSFRWKDPEEDARDGVRLGLVAQEVEPVIPELVHTSSHGGIKAVDPAQLTAVLVEAMKELEAKNEALERRVAELEADRRR